MVGHISLVTILSLVFNNVPTLPHFHFLYLYIDPKMVNNLNVFNIWIEREKDEFFWREYLNQLQWRAFYEGKLF